MESESIHLPNRKFRPEPGYAFIREIASGGYGSVYLFAKETPAGKPKFVAGKFVYRGSFGPEEDPASSAAYQRALEGLHNFRSLSAESTYLLRVFDVRQRHEEGYFCYMMELADDVESGHRIRPVVYKPRTLRNEMERGGQRHRLPVAQCVDITKALARGLRVLHEGGFTHRDVRPSNIIFVRDIPKLADIDLLAGHDAALASYIPRDYAAPEGSHSIRADLFSLGKTLYEISTGLPVNRYPCVPLDLRQWNDHETFLKLNKIISRACARDLRKRYDSTDQLLADLEQV